jgi:DNA invertase Pin-like site-specific DNA recombinase
MSQILGYARVSTVDQDPALQIEALRREGAMEVFTDWGASGKLASRPQLDALLNRVCPGDTILVWKLDRLGRSVSHLAQLMGDLATKGIRIRSTTEGIDTGGQLGRAMFYIASAFAELERENTSERTKAGLAVARAQGRIGGRPRKNTPELRRNALTLQAAGMSYLQIAKALGVSKPVIGRALKKQAPPSSA